MIFSSRISLIHQLTTFSATFMWWLHRRLFAALHYYAFVRVISGGITGNCSYKILFVAFARARQGNVVYSFYIW